MTIKHVPGPHGTFDERLAQKFDEFFQCENLIQAILHAHLLIEQALNKKLEKKLARPEVLHSRKYAQLSFAQKAALYIGLYEPDEKTERILLGFNKIRNLIAHQLADDAEGSNLVAQYLSLEEMSSSANAMDRVRVAFGCLAFFELGAVHGVRRTDVDFPENDVDLNEETVA